MSQPYISFITFKIHIKGGNLDVSSLARLGATIDARGEWNIPFGDDTDLASKLMTLRDMSIAFSAGKDWPPCSQFEHLRDRGLVSGKYLQIAWSGPDDFSITEK